MKPRILSTARLSLPLATALAALLNSQAHATDYYWDDNATGADFGVAGASVGTWAGPTAGPTAGWSLSTTGADAFAPFTTGTGDDLFFGNGATGLGAGTVAVSGAVSARNITFASGSGAIVLSGGTSITLAPASVITVNNTSNTISTPLAGAATSLTVNGSGNLILGGTVAATTWAIGSGATLTYDNNADKTINALSGAGRLAMSGTGTLSLATGIVTTSLAGITLSSGILDLGVTATSLNTQLTVTGNSSLYADGSGTTYTSVGGITLTSGILSIANNTRSIAFTGAVTGAGGIDLIKTGQGATNVFLNSTSNSFTGTIRFNNNATGQNSTFATNSLADSASSGAGNITFGQAVTTGEYRFIYGTGTGSPSAALSLTNRRFVLASTQLDQKIANNSGQAVNINSDLSVTGSGTKTLTLGGTGAGTSTFAGDIAPGSSTLSIEKVEAGTWILSGANTYGGDTTIGASAGQLRGDVTGTSLTPTSPFGTSTIKLNGSTLGVRASGTLDAAAETVSFGNNVVVGGNAIIDVNRPGATSTNKTMAMGTLSIGANTLTVTRGNGYNLSFGATTLTGNATFALTTGSPTLTLGAIGETGGARSISKTGAGSILILSANNTFTGGLSITQGTVLVGNAGALNSTAGSQNAVTFASAATGILSLAGNSVVVRSLNTNATPGTPVVRNANGSAVSDATLTVGNSLNLASTFAGTIQDGTGGGTLGLIKAGTNTLTLSGTNTYTGTTTVSPNGGTLQIDAATALSSGSQIILTKTGVQTGTLRLNTSGTNVYNNAFGSFSAANTTVNGGSANIQNAQGDNTMSGDIALTAGGGNGVNIQSDAGLLTISGDLSTGTGATGTRPFTFSGAGNGVFSGQMIPFDGTKTPSIIKNGAGTWSVTGTTSSFTGGVSVLAGVLNVASVANIGSNSSIGAGGPINLSGQGTSGTLQYTGSTAVETNHALNVDATGGTLDASGTGSGTIKFAGTFTATSAASTNLTYTNGSTVATNGASSIPGTVGGNVMTVNALGLDPGTKITSISGNSYTLSNAFTGTTGAVGTTFTDNVARTLTLTGSNAGANEISSNMGNSPGGAVLSISKSGLGTWVLSGTNTYTGNTNISAGSLVLADNAQLKFVLGAASGLNNSISGAGTATLNGDFNIDTSAANALPAGSSWTLESVTSLTGAYGVDFTVIGFVDAGSNKWTKANGATTYTFDETTGILELVAAGSGSAYSNWATDKGLTGGPGSDTDPAKDADPDKDGNNNLYEFAFDGDPLSGVNDGKIVAKVGTVGLDQVLTLTLPVRDAASFNPDAGDQLAGPVDGIYYRIEGSTDLIAFADTITEVTGLDAGNIQNNAPAVPTPAAGWTRRTFRVPGTVLTAPKAFLRATVSETP